MEDNLNFWEMVDDLNFWIMEDDLNLWKMEDNLNFWENGRQPKTIKSKINGCCTAPGNLVLLLLST